MASRRAARIRAGEGERRFREGIQESAADAGVVVPLPLSPARERILDAAFELMADPKRSRPTVANICRRAAVAPTSIYWHFGSMAGLVEAVVQRAAKNEIALLLDFGGYPADPPERVGTFLEGLRQLVGREGLFVPLAAALATKGPRLSPPLLEAFGNFNRQAQERLSDSFEAAAGGPLDDSDVIALLIKACVNYAALVSRIDPDSPEIDVVFRRLHRAILLIVGPRLAEREAVDDGG